MARASFFRGLRSVFIGIAWLAAMPTVALAQFGITPSLSAGCDWIPTFDPADPNVGNSAFPEANVRYWLAVVTDTVPTGTRLRIEGRYPDARYSALFAYDGNIFLFDSLSDNQLLPDPGNANLNLDRTMRDAGVLPGGNYTAFLRIGVPIPAVRERNTLYRAGSGLLQPKARKRTLLAYRTYLPEGGDTGGVGLPRLVLQRPGLADLALASTPDVASCAALGQALRGPRPAPISRLKPLVPAKKPVFQKFDAALLQATGLGAGFNPHNGFMYAKTQRSYADLMVVRGRMPHYTTQNPADITPQVRFFSMCQYGSGSTQVHGCISDRELPLDEFGFYTVLITKDAVRPPGLLANYGWLPFGPENGTAVAIRELLAHPSFAQSIERAPSNAGARDGYTPLLTYCSLPVLAQAAAIGLGPAGVYSACAASR
ncbi:MAG: hypothetical protein ACT4PZ_04295 [Panacagrimonas sp.]